MKDSALSKLSRKDRMRLLRFVCSFAWADFEVGPEERQFVASLMERLALDDEEAEKVQGWLEEPPPPDMVDPGLVPNKHRKLFLEAIEGVVVADGQVTPSESENLDLFRQLLA